MQLAREAVLITLLTVLLLRQEHLQCPPLQTIIIIVHRHRVEHYLIIVYRRRVSVRMGQMTLRRHRPHRQPMVQEMEVLQEEVLLVITTITIYIIINTIIPLHLSQVDSRANCTLV